MKRLTPDEPLHPPDDSAYETDFVRWIERQVELLRAKQFERLDLDNVIEELESIGSSQRHELKSRLGTLLMHLLKCQFQPERKTGSWLSTLHEQREEISIVLEASPSLRDHVLEYANRAYQSAANRAALETGLPRNTFPATNPFSKEQLLDPDFVP